MTTQKEDQIYVYVLQWSCKLLALPALPTVRKAQSFPNSEPVHLQQNNDGIVLNLPEPHNKEVDRVVVLTLAK